MIMGLKRRKSNKSGLVGGKRGKWIFFFFLIMKEKRKFCFCKWGGKFFLLLEIGVGSFFFFWLFSGKLKRRFLW